jgi:ubiquinone/menaquinone biosynthesis C-methylase UbiE
MFRAAQLYTFLDYCEGSSLEKEVLECGAGVSPDLAPLLVRFFERGYKTHGVEISAQRMEAAVRYCEDHQLDLDIRQGDMRELPFEDESLSFVFSYNAIFHMTKRDIALAMGEIERVLKPGGMCFVNFLSVDSESYGRGEELEKGEFVERGAEWDALHTYYEDDEPDVYFVGFSLMLKEKRILERFAAGESYVRAYIDYIAMKARS